jgi:hypothetical protein
MLYITMAPNRVSYMLQFITVTAPDILRESSGKYLRVNINGIDNHDSLQKLCQKVQGVHMHLVY